MKAVKKIEAMLEEYYETFKHLIVARIQMTNTDNS